MAAIPAVHVSIAAKTSTTAAVVPVVDAKASVDAKKGDAKTPAKKPAAKAPAKTKTAS
jgi:hypothetical protein